MSPVRQTLARVLLALLALPPLAWGQDAPTRERAAEGDPDGDDIDFATADTQAALLVYRRDVERAAGVPWREAGAVIDAELEEIVFPAYSAPFAPGVEQSAWTPAMAEALAIAIEAGQATGDVDWGLALMPMWGRLTALDDLPAWAATCRWALLGGPPDPTPCERLAALHAVAHGDDDPRVIRASQHAAQITGGSTAMVPEWAVDGPLDRFRDAEGWAASALDGWDGQVAAGLSARDVTAVLEKWGDGLDFLEALGPPMPADAGAWPISVVEGVVLRAHLGRLSAEAAVAYGGLPQMATRRLLADADAAFGAIPLWHRLDPDPDAPGDVPALGARCRDQLIRGVDDGRVEASACVELADRLEVATGPLDPAVVSLRARAGLPAPDLLSQQAFASLIELSRPPPDDRPSFLESEGFELPGLASTWDAELAVGTPVERVPALIQKYRLTDLYDLTPLLMAPNPDGGAWRPSIVDGLVVAVIEGQMRGDAGLGIGGLDGWRAAVSGPDRSDGAAQPERHDLPALTALCRARLMRWQLGQRPPDPTDCVALADALEWGLGPLNPDTIGARLRAAALSADDPIEGPAQQALLDASWPAPIDGETRRAQARLASWGDVQANLYRADFVEYFDVDADELLDAWEQEVAAGLAAGVAAEAVAGRAAQWVGAMSRALTPPFPADAGAWPGPLAEAVAAMVEIGRRTGRARLLFDLLPALARVEDTPTPEADVPALSARCRRARIAAMDGRPADEIEACEALLEVHRLGLGELHPRVTAERLRLSDLRASRGERVAADDRLTEALALWADPPTVDSADEAVWALARALRSKGQALRALGRPRDGLGFLVAGRTLAATTGYERLGDGLRFLSEEADLVARLGDQAAIARLLLDIQAEAQAAEDRHAARIAADEVEPGFADLDAMRLATAETLFTLGRVIRLLPVDSAEASGREAVASAWRGMEADGLTDHPLAVEVLARLARDAADAADPDGARQAAHRALGLQTRLDHRQQPWLPPAAAAEAARAAGRLAVAIAWAKDAVDAAQAARLEVGSRGPDAERAFIQAHTALYDTLIGLLVEAGRLVEADATERRRGEVELAALTRAEAHSARDPVPRTAPERLWQGGFEAAARTLRAATERERSGAEARFADRLDDLEARLDRISREPEAAEPDDLPARLAALGSTAGSTAQGSTALLQITPAADQTFLVLTTPGGRQRFTRAVGQAALNARAYAFYRALRGGAALAEVHARARALYDELLAPVAAALDAEGVTTLMLAPNSALRYVPFSALMAPDGRFAVERWAIVRYPVLSAEVFDRPPLARDRVAAFGAPTGSGGLSGLPSVPAELEGIVRRDPSDADGALPGTIALDAAFTAEALRAALIGGAPVVHIASHFVFRPGSAADSFLALGAGRRLSLERLASPAYPFERVDLLALSACETAVGTFAAGQPLDSFSALALRKGARSVLASLWPVADDSTAALMRAFYRHLAAGRSKAEALRQAQLALIGGPAPTGAPRKFGLPGVEVSTGAHPYAWAPFVLTGDWR